MSTGGPWARGREKVARSVVAGLLIGAYFMASGAIDGLSDRPGVSPGEPDQLKNVTAGLITLAVFTLTHFSKISPLSPILGAVGMLIPLTFAVFTDIPMGGYAILAVIGGLTPLFAPDGAIVWYLPRPTAAEFATIRREQIDEQVRLLREWHLYNVLRPLGVDRLLRRWRLF